LDRQCHRGAQDDVRRAAAAGFRTRHRGVLHRHFTKHPGQAVCNAKLVSEARPDNPLEELDLVVNSGGRILVFDLKLTNEEDTSVVDQMAKVAEARRLGGIGAVGVMVRPTWNQDSERFHLLARQFGITLWTQREMGGILGNLSKILRIPLPEFFKGLHEKLLSAAKRNKSVFSSRQSIPPVRPGRTTRRRGTGPSRPSSR
jgi:hypothetical protein